MSDIDLLASFLAGFWRGSSDKGAEDAIEYRTLLENTRCKLLRVNRTVARDRFHRIADSDDITIVTNHDRTDEAMVMMRGAVLAGLLGSVAEAAVKRASRSRPLIARLEGLQPVPAGHERVQLRYDTGQTAHRLHSEAESKPAVR
jgi:hypothetical protein